MEELNPAEHPPDADSPRGNALALISQGLLLLGEVLALMWLIERVMSDDWLQALCLAQFVLAMVAASAALYCASKRRKKLYHPIIHLEKLLPEIRAGRAPLDDLTAVKGRLEPIAMQLHDMLHEIRSQQSTIAGMDLEVRQRVANKTEALERKIGSLKHLATRDALTGLLNRRALDEHLANAIARSAEAGTPLSVLMIDVDYFKLLNDTLGHAAGDEFLKSVGQVFRSTLRECDTAFRSGGDEFVVVLEGSDLLGANALSERLSKTVDALVKPLKVPNRPRLSIGAATLSDVTPRTAQALTQEADKRLYAIKGERKRTAIAAHSTPSNAPTRKSA